MLRELAAFGRAYKKFISSENNKKESGSDSVIVIYIDLDRNCEVGHTYMPKEDCEKLLGYNIYEPHVSYGTLEYPVGEFASIDKKTGRVKVLENRIINWFKKQDEYKNYYEILEKNIDNINRKLIEEKNAIDKDKKNFGKRKVIVTVKVSNKFPKEVLKPILSKEKDFIKGYCYICGEEKNNILLNYKDISKVFGFYTLDKAGFASNFDIKAMSANLPVCDDCLDDIKSAVIFWEEHFVDLHNGRRMWILPSLNEYRKEDSGDSYNDFKRKFKEFVNYLKGGNRDKNDIQKYLIDENSPDVIFTNKSYIIFRKNQKQWILEHEYDDVNVEGIRKIMEKDKNIISRNDLMKSCSFIKSKGLINHLYRYFIPEAEIFKDFSYYKDEVYSKSIEFTFNSIVNQGQLPKENYKDFVKLSNFVFDRIIRFKISEKSRKESKIKNILSSLYMFSLESLYTKSLLNISMGEPEEKTNSKGKIMNLITNSLSEDEQAFVYVGMLVGGLSKLQSELGISSNIIEKLLYLPDKQRILAIFNDANAKIRQYYNYRKDNRYSDFFLKFDILNFQISNLAEKLAHSQLSDDLAKFFFNIGIGFSYKYFYSGEDENRNDDEYKNQKEVN